MQIVYDQFLGVQFSSVNWECIFLKEKTRLLTFNYLINKNYLIKVISKTSLTDKNFLIFVRTKNCVFLK